MKQLMWVDLRRPMASVSWYDAIEFCNELSVKQGLKPFYKFSESEKLERDESGHITEAGIDPDKDGDGYRLPEEREWEYACRAMSAKGYHFGESTKHLPDYAVFNTAATEMCGHNMPNAWGLFDMHGNVWEWCWDKHKESEKSRVLRGGSFYDYYFPQLLRWALRYFNSPVSRNLNLGFRISGTP